MRAIKEVDIVQYLRTIENGFPSFFSYSNFFEVFIRDHRKQLLKGYMLRLQSDLSLVCNILWKIQRTEEGPETRVL